MINSYLVFKFVQAKYSKLKFMKPRLILLLIFLFSSIQAFSQEVLVKGSVVSAEDNQPILGANVIIIGTNKGTTTDFDGNYTLKVNKGEILEFRFLGFITQKITILKQTKIDIVLKPDVEALDEIVVIGYGTQKRADLTGSVTSIKSEDLLKQPAYTAVKSVQGKLSGVNIIASDSPGASPKVIIRGIGTASAGSDILYIVDGIQTNNISNINPADIETMDVLKDAASSSIYGMDAANGVIIITTKKGKLGKTKVNFTSTYGVTSILNKVKMANGSQYVTYFNENQETLGQYKLALNQKYDTDWYEELTSLGFSTNNNISFSGATETNNYFFSYNNYEEEGILENQTISRNTIRINNTFKAFDKKLKITSNITGTFTKSNPKPFGAFNSAYRQSPLVPVRFPDGHFGTNDVNITTGIVGYDFQPGEQIGGLNSVGNPYAQIYFTNAKNLGTNLQGMFEAELKLTNNLRIASRIGLTKKYRRTRIFNPIKNRFIQAGDPITDTEQEFLIRKEADPDNTSYANNSLSYTQNESTRYNWDTYITYKKRINNHSFNAVAGITRGQRNDIFESTILGYEVPEKEQYWSIEFADSANYDNISDQFFTTPQTQLSYFGRLQYNFDSKYFIQANIRRDGISTFKENKNFFGNFPSFSIGWVLTEENFLNDNKTLDFLKIRGGWGQVGNSSVPFNELDINTSTRSSDVNYVFGPNQELVYGAALGAPIFPISWEVTEETNLGLDFKMFNSKLSGAIDLYNRQTKDAILLVSPLRNSPNEDRFYDTGADVTNKGIEIELNWSDNINDDLSYNIGVVYSYNKNNVENVKAAYDGQIGGSLSNGQNTKRLEEGQPLYAWWMLEADGIWQNQNEIDNNPKVGSPKPGHIRYKDQNDDGVIDDKDKRFFGSYLPTYNLGINLGVKYKNIDFSVDAFGVGGNKVYNGLKGTRINGGENITAEVFNNRWTGDGSTNIHPGAQRDSKASSYYLEDGSFLRINNISLGYTINKDVLFDLAKIRIYATAQNPFMFTNYTGFTPELIGSGSTSGISGIELRAYPNTKTLLFGINVEL